MIPAAYKSDYQARTERSQLLRADDPQALLDALPTAAVIVEPAPLGPICRAANSSFEEWAGLARHTALGLRIAHLPLCGNPALLHALETLSPVAEWTEWFEGEERRFIANVAPVGEGARMLVLLRDCKREGAFAPSVDGLTGLGERVSFINWTRAALATLQGLVAVMMIDIDRLASVNESLGYAMGDQLLCAIAQRLRTTVGDGIPIARIGGDRFAVLVTGITGPAAAMTVAARISASLIAPFAIEGCDIFVTAGIGIATSVRDCTADKIIRDSELAMHRAKREGEGRIELYQALPLDLARDRFLLESDIRRACERHQLFMVYQPIIDLKTNAISGFEALARWQHPSRGIVPPSDFIPVAETSGAIIPIGRWAIHTACQQLADWRRRLGPAGQELTMSVNLSGIQLARDNVVEMVIETIESSGIPADRLRIELTESVIIDNPERSNALLHRLKALGVTIAMDDFGTGYSSLGALNTLPIDVLKVDRSFVSGMDNSHDRFKIVDAILSLARSLGLSTTAEGVETQAEEDMLRALGCQSVQGYLYSKPVRADEAEAYIVSRAAA